MQMEYFAKIRHYVNFNILKCIYSSIFNLHLTHECQVWGQTINNVNHIIQQQKALKIIHFKLLNTLVKPLVHEAISCK